jgi:predicted phage terminase large subunit-like protein
LSEPIADPRLTAVKESLASFGIPPMTNFAEVCFAMQKNERYLPPEMHRSPEDELLKIVFGISDKNLMVCMPPRFGKTEFLTRIFMSWCFAFMPGCNFIFASATLDLARSCVKAVRDTVAADWYQKSFREFGCATIKNIPGKKASLTAAARSDFFETLQGGAVKGIGLGGQITGFGAGKKGEEFGGCIVCDDLLKEQDFDSQSRRDAVYEWMKAALLARRNSFGTPVILVMQRLHEDDIVGRLLREEPEEWDVFKVAALDEATQKSVREEAVSTRQLLKMKNSRVSLDRYLFAAKYQQEPCTDLNAMIKPEWWQYFDTPESIYRNIYYRIITMDTAYKSGDLNDESVMQLWGFSGDGQTAYLTDMEHGRWEFPELIARTVCFFRKHNTYVNGRLPEGVFIEDKASGPPLVQMLLQQGIPTQPWNPPDNSARDKVSRVLHTLRYVAYGRVYLPKNGKFTKDFVDQCAAFTFDKGAHDDMVDAMTMALLIWKKFGAQ